MQADCEKCKNKENECRPKYDKTCENYELDCHLCVARFAFCMCPKGADCSDFEFAEGDYETELLKWKQELENRST